MIGPVPKLWPGATVAIIAGGPSLRTQDLTPLWESNAYIITVNDSWRLLPPIKIALSRPFKCLQCEGGRGVPDEPCGLCRDARRISACAGYFCDASWWQQSMAVNRRSGAYSFHDAIYKLWWFSGSPDFRDHPQVNALQLTGQTGLEPDPTGLRHGSNSGYQAINLAVHLGAKKIILLGYDMKADVARKNWHDEPRMNAPDVYEKSMLPHFASLVKPLAALDIEVVNATPDSALECFPKALLEEALT